MRPGGDSIVLTAYAVARALAVGSAGEFARAWSANATACVLAVDLGVHVLRWTASTAAWAIRDRAVQHVAGGEAI
jgi:hypothetical protein